jgi:hypothetical protein
MEGAGTGERMKKWPIFLNGIKVALHVALTWVEADEETINILASEVSNRHFGKFKLHVC